MPFPIEKKFVIAVSSSALFDMVDCNKIFEEQGLEAYNKYQMENIDAQMLVAAGNELYYHTWPTPDGKHNYEIDFLLSRGKTCARWR